MVNPTSKLARWALQLQAYIFEVEHWKGSLNYVPGVLSQIFEEDETPIGGITFSELSNDEWFPRRFREILENLRDNPEWMIIGGKLYTYKKANSRMIIKEFNDRVIFWFDTPEIFHSDNGNEFTSKEIENELEDKGIHHSTNPIYHAQANPVERQNRTVKTVVMPTELIYSLDWPYSATTSYSIGLSSL